MAASKKVINFLDKNKARYELIEHRTVFTAFDKSQTLKLKPNIIGKTLVLKADGQILVVLIPANKNLDKQKFKKIVNLENKKIGQKAVKTISFVSERLMKNKFKGVKIGAVPPFGNLFGFPTFINNSLLKQPKIVVNAGDYNWSIKIGGGAFGRLTPKTLTEPGRTPLVVGSFVKPRK